MTTPARFCSLARKKRKRFVAPLLLLTAYRSQSTYVRMVESRKETGVLSRCVELRKSFLETSALQRFQRGNYGRILPSTSYRICLTKCIWDQFVDGLPTNAPYRCERWSIPALSKKRLQNGTGWNLAKCDINLRQSTS